MAKYGESQHRTHKKEVMEKGGGKFPSHDQAATDTTDRMEMVDPTTEGSLTAVAPPEGNYLDHKGKTINSISNGMRGNHTEQDLSATYT